MNKKEQAEMEALRQERDMYRAMYISEPVEPDIEKPERFDTVHRGWLYNEYRREAEKAAVSSIYHTRGEKAWSHNRNSFLWSQGTPCLYSTKSRALRAMRRELAITAAKNLAECDRKIEAAEQEERA